MVEHIDMLYPEREIAVQASKKLLEQVGLAISQKDSTIARSGEDLR